MLLKRKSIRSSLPKYSNFSLIYSPLKFWSQFFSGDVKYFLFSVYYPDLELTCPTYGGPWAFIHQMERRLVTRFFPFRLIYISLFTNTRLAKPGILCGVLYILRTCSLLQMSSIMHTTTHPPTHPCAYLLIRLPAHKLIPC